MNYLFADEAAFWYKLYWNDIFVTAQEWSYAAGDSRMTSLTEGIFFPSIEMRE